MPLHALTCAKIRCPVPILDRRLTMDYAFFPPATEIVVWKLICMHLDSKVVWLVILKLSLIGKSSLIVYLATIRLKTIVSEIAF